jgi:hypothetical protein
MVSGRDAAQAALAEDYSDYEERWRSDTTTYLKARSQHYSGNQRWRHDPFWARRYG